MNTQTGNQKMKHLYRIYHAEYGMLYPGEFRLKFNRDKTWYLLVPQSPKPYESPKLWTMMKYTGLKDKHGTKIYEGDIVNGVGWITHEPAIVEYENGGYWPYAVTGHEGTEDANKSEIIGNIYEQGEPL